MRIIGIAGGSGSGKTTFAKKIIAKLPSDKVNLLHMDSYYLHDQPEEFFTSSGKPNFDHPSSFDWELLRNHLHQLKDGHAIEVPTYDFKTSARLPQTIHMSAKPLILFEGIFTLFDSEIRKILDIKTFLHVDADIRFTRRLNRDVVERGRTIESVTSQYYETVRPMYQKFLAPQQQYADFIVGEETDIAADILASKLNDYLKEDASIYQHLINNQYK